MTDRQKGGISTGSVTTDFPSDGETIASNNVVVQMILQGSISTFNSNAFVSNMSVLLEISESRIKILKIRAGSVIVIFEIAEKAGELSASYFGAVLEQKINNKDPSLEEIGFIGAEVTIPSTPSISSSETQSLTLYYILIAVAFVVGAALVLLILGIRTLVARNKVRPYPPSPPQQKPQEQVICYQLNLL